MTSAFDGSSIDGSGYLDVVRLARHWPSRLDGLVLSGRRALTGLSLMNVVRRRSKGLARRIASGPLRPLLVAP